MPRQPHEISDATLSLVLASGIGPATLRALRDVFSSDEAIVDADVYALAKARDIGAKSAESIRRAIDDAQPQRERELMLEHGAALILHGDDEYPPLLAAIAGAPIALWVQGRLEQQDRLAIAIVGSRKCTSYGREQASRFAQLLAQNGLTIVSGGARGVDGEAHRAALRVGGRTIAVLGCGVTTRYPPEHAELFERMISEGSAVISELPMQAPPKAEHFPQRNRIISGLSLGVLVIEAAHRSGALITARQAAEEHGREVMAVPGRVDSPASAGCLRAIREGWAALVTDHAEVLAQLGSASELVRGALELSGAPVDPSSNGTASLFGLNLSGAQQKIVSALEQAGETIAIDRLAALTSLSMQQIMADITLLEIRGTVRKDRSGVRLRR